MELKEFIETALLDIINGVESARSKIKDNKNADICPVTNMHAAKAHDLRFDHMNGVYHQSVDFDIAVTIENETSGSGKAGIKVCGIEANLGGDKSSNNTTITRVKFHVPIGLSCKKELNNSN